MTTKDFNKFSKKNEGKQVKAKVKVLIKKSPRSIYYSGFKYVDVKGKLKSSLGGSFSFVQIGKWTGRNQDIQKISLLNK